MSEDFVIRKIKPEDNPIIARIIRTVMPQFGASGDGFAIKDAEVDTMYEAYSQPRSIYYVSSIMDKSLAAAESRLCKAATNKPANSKKCISWKKDAEKVSDKPS